MRETMTNTAIIIRGISRTEPHKGANDRSCPSCVRNGAMEAPKFQARSKKRYWRTLMRDFGLKLVRGIKSCSDHKL